MVVGTELGPLPSIVGHAAFSGQVGADRCNEVTLATRGGQDEEIII